MEKKEHTIQHLRDIADLLLTKMEEKETELTLEFQDTAVKGPGPQGAPGEWRISGKVTLKTKATGKA